MSRIGERRLTWGDRIVYLVLFAGLIALAFLGGR